VAWNHYESNASYPVGAFKFPACFTGEWVMETNICGGNINKLAMASVIFSFRHGVGTLLRLNKGYLKNKLPLQL